MQHTHTHTHTHTLTHTHRDTDTHTHTETQNITYYKNTHTHTHSHTHTGELAPQETQREGFCDVIGRGGLDAGKRQTRNTHSFTGEVHCFHASETHTHKHI